MNRPDFETNDEAGAAAYERDSALDDYDPYEGCDPATEIAAGLADEAARRRRREAGWAT